jgi:hypothetical protein
MMNTFCLDSQKDLDDGIYMPLFAVRKASSKSFWLSKQNVFIIFANVYLRLTVLCIIFKLLWIKFNWCIICWNKWDIPFSLANIRREVDENCWSCNICRVKGKPNQRIHFAPLRFVPSFECRRRYFTNYFFLVSIYLSLIQNTKKK